MSEPILVFLTAELPTEQFATFLSDAGAEWQPDDVFEGQLSQQDRYVWLTRSPEMLEELIMDRPDTLQQITQRLGGEPRTCVVLETSNTPGSDHVAVQFIVAFAQHWPCIVDNLHGQLYTSAEVQALYATGSNFADAQRTPV